MTVELTCEKVAFFSELDEEMFFSWIQKIDSVIKAEGVGQQIRLHVQSEYLPDKCLRELLALFWRYQINMRQFRSFRNHKNEKWFKCNREAFWYESVWID